MTNTKIASPITKVLEALARIMRTEGRIADRVADKLVAPAFACLVGATLLVRGGALLLK